jgi:anti-sigma-K factor RskA
MLAVPADRLPDAIGDLDPGNRALLDLSLRRGVSDSEIGELLRKEPTDVARGRDAVLELLADALEVNGHDRRERVREAVAGLPDDAWQVRAPAPTPPPTPSAEPVDEEELDEPATEPEAEGARDLDRAATAREFGDELYLEPEGKRRSSRTGLIALLGLAAVIVALILLLSSGGDDDDDSGATQGNGSPPAQNGGPGPQANGKTQKLIPLGNGKGTGTVTVTDEGATVTVSGLPKPDGDYQVWLYNDIVDAQSLGTISGGSGKVQVKLPSDASDYRFLDVSNEPADANPNHSGASVLRAPLGELLNN